MTTPFTLTCHCGAVELEVYPGEDLTDARRCDCSYCRRRGTPTLMVPLDGLRIVRGAGNLTLYTFGTHTAQHHFCRTCGIYTHHRRRSNPNDYGVNMGALNGVNPAEHEPIGWNDGVNHPSDS